MYTASTALLEALSEWGVSHIFANFGSDHPALIEAIAEAHSHGRAIPSVITSPNEMVALSCAHGYAQATGRAQAVFVHVECGTQALAGAVHNAAKGRVPVFIFAGMSPFTQGGGLTGSRNEFIQWIQDVHDQRGIVRGYMKYDNEYRTGTNLKQVTYRAMQIAHSDPKGPVYLVGAREVMEQAVEPVALDRGRWLPVAPQPLPADGVAEIVAALASARRPLVVTSYVGRRPEAAAELVRLARGRGAGVLESVPSMMNFPHDNPLYEGSYWSHPFQNRALAEADVVLVVDSDVPWIPTVNRPSPRAAVYHIDIDPLKAAMPLVHRADTFVPGRRRSGAETACRRRGGPPAGRCGRSRAHCALCSARKAEPADVITAEYVAESVRKHLPPGTIVLNEGITNYPTVADRIAPTLPGASFASGGGSLGWHGGAAIGIKLAFPERTVVALTGDGSNMFSVPSTVHWMARQYKTPFLTVVFNNRGWEAPKFSALAVYPNGYAARANEIDVSFDPRPDYAGIAAVADGAFARTVKTVDDVEPAIAAALAAVRDEKRAAVRSNLFCDWHGTQTFRIPARIRFAPGLIVARPEPHSRDRAIPRRKPCLRA